MRWGCFFLSLRRRALAPLAWLRAIRRAAQSRRPVCFAARPLSWPTPCRLPGVRLFYRARDLSGSRDAPWCGGGRLLGAPASPHAKRNPTDHDSRDVRALLRRAAAAHPARGRGRGHRRRRHHRRNHGQHPGRGRRVLSLRRRPLRQEHAWPDPPAAGGRPRQRGVGASARRAYARPGGAHPDRDPADAGALRSGRSQPARGARVDGRARPPGAGSQAHRGHRQAPSRGGAGGGEGSQGRARRGPGAGQEGPLARGRGRHSRGRRGEAPAACARRHIGAGRPLESCGTPLIPVNPT